MAKRKAGIASTLASEAAAVTARRAAADGDDTKDDYGVDEDEDDEELAGMPPLLDLTPAAAAAAAAANGQAEPGAAEPGAEAPAIYTEEEFAKIAIETAGKRPILPVPKLYYFGSSFLVGSLFTFCKVVSLHNILSVRGLFLYRSVH